MSSAAGAFGLLTAVVSSRAYASWPQQQEHGVTTAIAIKTDTDRLANSRAMRLNPYLPLRYRAAGEGAALLPGELSVTNIIEAKGLKRTFKAKGTKGQPIEAVRGIDLSVREGEIVGFLGPNG